MHSRTSRQARMAAASAIIAASLWTFGQSAYAVSVGVPPQGLDNNPNMGGGPTMTQGQADDSGTVPLKGEEPWRVDANHTAGEHHHMVWDAARGEYVPASTYRHHHARRYLPHEY